ncbi:MAG: hypothetical protein WD971_13910 [Pirellulales bacterium]
MLKIIYRSRTLIVALALVAVLAMMLTMATVASACPTCKEGVDASDPNHKSLALGFYYSILFMMSMPYILLGTLGFVAYNSVKKAKLREQSEVQPTDAAGDC